MPLLGGLQFPQCRLVVVVVLFASLPVGIVDWQTAKSLRGKDFLGHFATLPPNEGGGRDVGPWHGLAWIGSTAVVGTLLPAQAALQQ